MGRKRHSVGVRRIKINRVDQKRAGCGLFESLVEGTSEASTNQLVTTAANYNDEILCLTSQKPRRRAARAETPPNDAERPNLPDFSLIAKYSLVIESALDGLPRSNAPSVSTFSSSSSSDAQAIFVGPKSSGDMTSTPMNITVTRRQKRALGPAVSLQPIDDDERPSPEVSPVPAADTSSVGFIGFDPNSPSLFSPLECMGKVYARRLTTCEEKSMSIEQSFEEGPTSDAARPISDERARKSIQTRSQPMSVETHESVNGGPVSDEDGSVFEADDSGPVSAEGKNGPMRSESEEDEVAASDAPMRVITLRSRTIFSQTAALRARQQSVSMGPLLGHTIDVLPRDEAMELVESFQNISIADSVISTQPAEKRKLYTSALKFVGDDSAHGEAKAGAIDFRALVLAECEQEEPIGFSELLSPKELATLSKIGEGVYGEVFRFDEPSGKAVIKIIPIEGDFAVNEEVQKNFEQIWPEIVIARVSCIRGAYPKRLLDAWSRYDEEKHSENDCPDVFDDDQLFIVFKFAYGGCDLESAELNSVEQASSIVAQVATTLSVAERELSFEHRDLHWGNVLVHPTMDKHIVYLVDGDERYIEAHGVHAYIIDFTLSRLQRGNCIVYNDLSILAPDDGLFLGEGDFQFDIYRVMRELNGNEWDLYNAYTNVLWLRYLVEKLFKTKTYPPAGKTTNTKGRVPKRRKLTARGDGRELSALFDRLRMDELYQLGVDEFVLEDEFMQGRLLAL